MSVCKEGIRAVVFDYGSTLIEFGTAQIHACDAALAETLDRLYGPVDFDALQRVRNEDRVAPYVNGYYENDMAGISRNLVKEIYGREPSDEELGAILDVRYAAFVEAIASPDYLGEFLGGLKTSYKLGLLSNYPDAGALRASLDKVDLTKYFDAIAVSGDFGRVKPHELPFQKILERLDVRPAEALYVGDNWLGDIQGAKKAGLLAAWTHQFDSPEKFDRRPGDVDPDITIQHITELREYLQTP